MNSCSNCSVVDLVDVEIVGLMQGYLEYALMKTFLESLWHDQHGGFAGASMGCLQVWMACSDAAEAHDVCIYPQPVDFSLRQLLHPLHPEVSQV